MRTIDWFVVDYFAARGGLYVHFRNIGMYMLLILLYDKPLPLHFVEWDSRGPPLLYTDYQLFINY